MALEDKITEVAENPFYSPAYHRAIREGKLTGSRCRACGHISVPPKPLCLECLKSEVDLLELKGNGRLAAYTVIHVAPPLMADEGFGPKNPYCCGVVELEEGPKVSARILGFDLSRPEQIKIGSPVRVEYVEAGQGEERETFLAFRAVN